MNARIFTKEINMPAHSKALAFAQSRNALAALAALSLALGLTACKKEEGKAEAAEEDSKKVVADTNLVIRVVAQEVKSVPYEDWSTYSADLRGGRDAVLNAGGGGRVNFVENIGKVVKAGQALCDIESERYEAMLKQAKSGMDIAKAEVDRMQSNVDKGFVGKTALDQALFAFQQSRVGYLQAKRAYEDSRCQSPFAGVLASRYIEEYNTAAPGSPTVRIYALDNLEAVVAIPEAESFGYHEGQAAEFLDVNSAKVIKGKIKSIDRAVESRNRTVTARVQLPGSKDLKPGMVGRVRVLRQKYEKAIVIPSQAVLRMQQGTAVMVVVGERAKQVNVVLGSAREDAVLVTSGLSDGDKIITTGAFQVTEGTKVTY
jgi:membrane fusion protein, multidrug efflux system